MTDRRIPIELASQRKVRDDRIPFPPDALREGRIVKREIVFSTPVTATRIGPRQKSLTQPRQRGKLGGFQDAGHCASGAGPNLIDRTAEERTLRSVILRILMIV